MFGMVNSHNIMTKIIVSFTKNLYICTLNRDN